LLIKSQKSKDLSHDRTFFQQPPNLGGLLLVEVARVLPSFVLPLIPKLMVGGDFTGFAGAGDGLDGDRAMSLSFPTSSNGVVGGWVVLSWDGVVGHWLGDEDFFSGAGELNSAADTVGQRNQVF
jgi:hypothetical protein